jgi:hypothetical protein
LHGPMHGRCSRFSRVIQTRRPRLVTGILCGWQTPDDGLLGSVVLIISGVIPTLQPEANSGRVYAAYGGIFVVLSLLWGWQVGKKRKTSLPTRGKRDIFDQNPWSRARISLPSPCRPPVLDLIRLCTTGSAFSRTPGAGWAALNSPFHQDFGRNYHSTPENGVIVSIKIGGSHRRAHRNPGSPAGRHRLSTAGYQRPDVWRVNGLTHGVMEPLIYCRLRG